MSVSPDFELRLSHEELENIVSDLQLRVNALSGRVSSLENKVAVISAISAVTFWAQVLTGAVVFKML